MSLLGFALDRPKLTLFAVTLAAAFGVLAFAGAAQSMFPQIELSRVEVFVRSSDLPPERMRATIVGPIEKSVAMLPGLRTSRSTSTQGQAEIELDFDPHADIGRSRQRVDAALAELRPDLPPDIKIATVVETPAMEPVVSYALWSDDLSQARLQHTLEQRLTATFAGTPGLDRITIFGGAPLEYQITLDARHLARARMTPIDAIESIAAATRVAGDTPSDSAALAGIRLGDGPATQQASFNGRHAVIVNAYASPGADAVALQRVFSQRLERLAGDLPATHSVRYWDQTRLIEASQRSLRNAILIGAILALLVIYLFLRSAALTAAAAIVIPIAIAVSTGLLVAGGMSLNLMTLGGLAIAVGLIIDEVIVVLEAIARELAASSHAPQRQAILRALRKIVRPLVASTAANIVVFAPLALLSGIPGFFFRALALTLAIALVVSIVLSLFVAPLVAGVMRPRASARAEGRKRLETWYGRILQAALDRPLAVYAGAGAILLATAFLFVRLPTDFLPALQEGQFEIKYTLPAGTSLAATDAIVTGLERLVLADPAVQYEGRLTGIDTDGYLPTAPNAGTIRVALKPHERFENVADRLRRTLGLTHTAKFEFHQLLEDQLNDLSGAPEPIQIAISGPEQRGLIAIARALTRRIDRIPGIDDPFDGVVSNARIVTVSPPAGAGATWLELARARFGDVVVGQIPDGAGTIPVRVKLAGATPFARTDEAQAPALATDVLERDGQRMLLVTAGIEGKPLSAVMPRVRAAVASVTLPAGYSVEIGGADEAQRASFDEFVRVLGIAVVLVFAVLLVAFNSFRLPLVILATIPLSPIGVALALHVTHTPLNVSSFMGLLLLVGVVVRNGILLIDAANRRHAAGSPVQQALLGAGSERLRPILMTVLAAIGALVPLALGVGSGSEMERPLAIAVIGGLATSTFFTLVLIPALYAAVMRDRQPLASARATLLSLAGR
jgi:multidrug efflux pump subunit AcrB